MAESFTINKGAVTAITNFIESIQSNGETKITATVDGKAVSQTLPVIERPALLFYDPVTTNFFQASIPSGIDPNYIMIKALE